MSDLRKYIQAQKFKLAGSGINTTDTTITLQSFQLPDGTNITTTDIGSLITGTIGPGTSKEEIISFTTVTQNADGTATLTGVTRGLKFNDPYTAGSGLGKSHAGGSIFILTNNPQMYAGFTNKDNDESITGLWIFSQLPESTGGNATSGTQLITYAQALALATGTANINRIVVAGTAGETIAVDQLVYLKASDGQWWKADADAAASSDNVILGIAQGSGTAGNTITSGVLLFGLNTFSSLTVTANTKYYVSNTAGGFSSTPGTVEITVGFSQSTTTLLFFPKYDQQLTEDQQDALAGTSTSTPNASNKYVDNADTSNGNNVDQSQTTQDASVAVGEADATTKYYKIAQSFVAGKSPIVSVDLYKSANTGTYTGDVTVAIYADSGGSPTGSALATVTTANATYNALSTGANTFTFSASYVPTLGTTYWIVISSSTGDNSNHPNLGTNSAGGYGSGSVKFNNTTDGWGAIATIDLYFKVNTQVTGKVVRFDSTGKYPAVDGSQITNVQATSLSKQVTSGENIAAGVPAWIYNADSKAYTSHGFKSLDSTTLNLAAAPTTSHKTAKLSDTQMMYLTDNGTTTLTINVFDINSAASVATATVTTSFDQTTDSTPTLPSATMCRLSDTTFVVFYARTTDNNLYFRTGSISGATITMDTETAYSGTPTFCYGMTAVPGASAGKVVFSYFDMTQEITTGGDSAQVLSYLTVSTNSVSVDTTVSYTLSSAGFNVTPQWSNCCFTNGIAYGLYSCKDGAGIAEVSYNYINVNNSVTASNQYTLNLESQTGAGTSAAYATIIPFLAGHDGKGYFGWATSDGTSVNTKTVLEISQIGCKIAYQATTVRSAGDTTISALKIFGNECGVIASGFADSITGAYYNGSIYIQKGKVYGFYSGDTLGIRANIPQAQAWYSNSKDEVVVCYLDNSANGFIKQWKLPTPSAGLVTTAVTAPATVTIWQNSATTSGLTANSPYFLKDTYTTIGDMSNTGTIPVGQALSATVIDLS